MTGAIDRYETARGERWRVRYRLAPSADGKRRRATKAGFTSLEDAEKFLRRRLVELDDGEHADPSTITVAQYLREEWLPSIQPRSATSARGHRGKVSATTWDAYRRDLERYVIPRIGGIRLQELEPSDLDRLYDELESTGGRSGNGLAAKTLANLHGTIAKSLKDAAKRGRVARNVAGLVEPPRAERTEQKIWTVDELRTFLEHVVHDDRYAGWLLFATTGARRGEIAGLTWDDIDLDAGRVRIEWTIGHVGHLLTWKPRPKTKAGERTMSLDPTTVAALRSYRAWQSQQRLAAGPAWQESFIDWQGLSRSNLVWTWGDGSIVHPKTWTEHFIALASEAGLPRIRLHDVRHTYASAALAAATGWHDVKVLSERLGHAKVSITLDTYSHILPERDREVANNLANVILGS